MSFVPETTGEENPVPTEIRQAGDSSAEREPMAGASSAAWPLRLGPRHCDQSSAITAEEVSRTAAQAAESGVKQFFMASMGMFNSDVKPRKLLHQTLRIRRASSS